MTSAHDWQPEIRARASRDGVALTEAMVEEIAEHLEDLHAAAMREGCSEADAKARARAALDESTMDVLRRATGSVTRPPFDEAVTVAASAGGRRLNLSAALRLAV